MSSQSSKKMVSFDLSKRPILREQDSEIGGHRIGAHLRSSYSLCMHVHTFTQARTTHNTCNTAPCALHKVELRVDGSAYSITSRRPTIQTPGYESSEIPTNGFTLADRSEAHQLLFRVSPEPRKSHANPTKVFICSGQQQIKDIYNEYGLASGRCKGPGDHRPTGKGK